MTSQSSTGHYELLNLQMSLCSLQAAQDTCYSLDQGTELQINEHLNVKKPLSCGECILESVTAGYHWCQIMLGIDLFLHRAMVKVGARSTG